MNNPTTILDFHEIKNLIILKLLNINSLALEFLLWNDIKHETTIEIYYNFWCKYNKKHGPYKQWYIRTKQLYLLQYYKDDKLNGLRTFWYITGNIHEISEYKNDKINGKVTVWNDDGNIKYEHLYENSLILTKIIHL